MTDWDPAAHAAFRSLRLRPALDLLAQVPDLPPGDLVDLGCGDGAASGPLAACFPGRRLVGVDASAAMLDSAQGYADKVRTDIGAWRPDTPPALIFSNAALHWLGDHETLLPRLAGLLAPAGTLAVQMPRNWLAPSHALLRDFAARLFPDRFDFTSWSPPTHPPETYWLLLAPLGRLAVWETDYLQPLAPQAEGHPVRAFTAATAMRPFLGRLSAAEAARFIAAYDAALTLAYPSLPDGTTLFPFRRLFLVLTRPRCPPCCAPP
ncbi:methyltransferase domain-containing protein [Rhodobacter sp. Har01]|uniref:methyltransferase domain-containing protein n=1 Tax=Rhodobacter sp. Har01 TaxID=2883999 RepID=UPI001D06E788|nr:methyltransferase domain-containing protein [Rhodobacter sp. Har01]MCB6178405.1 methyltransferase domain-containing protein [Rhodobacter sp. Har01]